MEKQNISGFTFYPGKYYSTFTSLSLINQSFLESNISPKSLGEVEESSRSQKQIKTKMIEKGKDKEKQEIKRYDRGGNCVASNTSKLFIKILNKRLSRFPLIQKYLNFYQIYSQKQNILLIPLCLYSFLKQYQHSSQNRFHLDQQVAQKRIFNKQQKFNTRKVYIDIINQLKDHIQNSLQNSRTKYKDCSDSKKQFHLKNISIYNKISEIIKKVEQLTYGLEDNPQLSLINDQNKIPELFKGQAQQQKSGSNPQLSSEVKIQEEQLHYSQVKNLLVQRSKNDAQEKEANEQKKEELIKLPIVNKKSQGYDLSQFQSPLQSLYQRKQREYQKAMDKVFCVIMNQKPLRYLFHIYKLDIQNIVLQSVNYCYRRNINSRVKKNQRIIKEIYGRLQRELMQALDIKVERDKLCVLRGWEFIISFLTIQLAGDKKAEIYEEFIENVKRKTKYFNLLYSTTSSDLKQQFDSYYYSYSLRIFQENYESQAKRKQQLRKQNLKELHENLKEWMIGYYYYDTLNKICLEEPKMADKMSIQFKGYDRKLLPEKRFLSAPQHNLALNTMQNCISQTKKQEFLKTLTPIQGEKQRNKQFFGIREQGGLEKLMLEFQNLLKENYENFY